MYCKHCGAEINENQEICLNCGCSVKENAAGGDKVVFALICATLGYIGIHNFFAGETKKGILKVILTCCTGVGGLALSIYDLYKIYKGTYVIEPDKFI